MPQPMRRQRCLNVVLIADTIASPLFSIRINEGLNLKVEEEEPTLTDYSYYWVISKNTDTGKYYLSSLKGDGYLGKGYGRDYSIEDETDPEANKKNIPICTDNYSETFAITGFVKQETVSGDAAVLLDGYAIKFVSGSSYRYVAVSEEGAINWFDHTVKGEYSNTEEPPYWTTDFEINEVTYAGLDEYGTWDSPTHYDFPVKFARSDDGKAVVTAEDYNYYATLKLPFASILPDGVTAYKITGPKNNENEVVGLEKLTLTDNILPYETPVLLSIDGGEGSTYPASKTIYLQPAKHHDIVTTGFNGTLGQKTFTDYDPSTNANYFILGKKNGRVAFYYLNNTVLAAHKAYYVYEGQVNPTMLAFSFGGGTTGMEQDMTVDTDDNSPIYDLAGRRVNAPKKGIYIRRGKKYVVK